MPRSIAHLETKSPTVLRKTAYKMMKDNPSLIYEALGMELSPADVRKRGKKEDLVNNISLWEGQLEKAKTEKPVKTEKAVETEKPVEALKTPPITEIEPVVETQQYTGSEAKKLEIAKNIYYSKPESDDLCGLQEYHLKLCQQNKYFLPEFAILVARSRVIIENHANAISPSGNAHPGSIISLKVDIMKYVKEFVDADNAKFDPVNDRQLTDTFKDFDDALRGAFRDISALKTKMYSASNQAAEIDVRAIKVGAFIDWAVSTVTNLSDDSARWKQVAVAVMLLTGRRQSEVMSSGIFEYADKSHVVFEGQLKRHIEEVVPAEKIPVLGNCAKEIINAIAWLEKYDKRSIPTERTVKAIQSAAKKSHDRCSRYVAEAMEKLVYLVPITNDKSWEVVKEGKTVNKFKGHLTRQIYAQVCEKLFSDSDNEKKQSFIARILLEGRDAAMAYDRDIEIKDIDDIKAKYGEVRA